MLWVIGKKVEMLKFMIKDLRLGLLCVLVL